MELESVSLPKKTMNKIRKLIKKNNGLFEDEVDYITHCIIDYNRRN